MKIAIIAPCILPVPATEGGAVEELITRIIEYNEIYCNLDIDLFTIYEDKAYTTNFNHTNLVAIKGRAQSGSIDRVLDKYYRTVGKSSRRTIDKLILDKFKNRINEIKPEYDAIIVENMMSSAVMIASYLEGKCGTPIYFHMHNDVDIYRSSEYIRTLVTHGVQFIAVSKYIEKQIKKHAPNAVIHLLYNGIDVDQYYKKNRTNVDNIRFLYAGRVIPQKGVKELVSAFEKVLDLSQDNEHNLTLDIIGFSNKKTPYEKNVLQLIGRHRDRITWHNRIPTSDMAKKYDDYDIVVFPTVNEEPFGMVALEAMSKGMPLIVSNSGALPEVVGDGAFIVEKDSNFVDNLVAAMIKIVGDKKYREKLGESAFDRSHNVSEFNIENYYTNLLKIIDKGVDNEIITVIVPVFNVEKYLCRCIDSIISQSYKNLEIILVDDGSTDDSGNICDEYASKDERIKVLHQKNQGLSEARNNGLEISEGEYIFFCDSDDYIEKDTLENMLGKLKHDNADIVACGIKYIGDDNGNIECINIVTDLCSGIWSGKQSVVQMMRKANVCSVAWNKLYKRSLFEGIKFPKGHLHEDEATIYKILYKAGIVSYTPAKYYCYMQRSKSIMGEKITGRSSDYIIAMEDRIKFFEDVSEYELAEYSWIKLLEWIKHVYRKINDEKEKKRLSDLYSSNINFSKVPSVMGIKKKVALLLWKYYKY